MPEGPAARVALVLAATAAVGPPGVDPDRFAEAALADGYEVLAALADVRAGVVTPSAEVAAELLWPTDLAVLTEATDLRRLVEHVPAGTSACVLVAADAPDLPQLVLAKVFQALARADVAVAPCRNHAGLVVAVGVRLPLPDWLGSVALTLDPVDGEDELVTRLRAAAPRRSAVAVTPGWSRLRDAGDASRLDPGLEGWDAVRLLLSERPTPR